MSAAGFFRLLRKSFGDARFSGYPTFREKLEVFKVLMQLSLKSETGRTDHKPTIQNIFGFKVTSQSYRETLYLFREIFLEFQYSFKSENPAPKIIDCGANIGMAILFFKKIYPESHIIAFEANPVIFPFLQKNIDDNELSNVQLFNLALSNTEGRMSFYVDDRNSLIGSLDPDRYGLNRREVIIDSTRLTSYLSGNTFDLAKIDVEGAEFQILDDLEQGGAITLVDKYIIEYHHNITREPNLSKFLAIFESHGFGYNIKTSFQDLGAFQDISISFYRRTKI